MNMGNIILNKNNHHYNHLGRNGDVIFIAEVGNVKWCFISLIECV